jgi:CheY-like chemotaxis protein
MTNLLIHSQNTSLLELEEFQKHNVDFKIPSDTDVDRYISDLITEQIEPVNPSTIFIKYALGNDYLAFLGLRLAHHIRLHSNRLDLSTIPIIFVGEENVSELIRISDYSDILATSGVYYLNEDLNKVKMLFNRIDQGSLEGLKSRENYLKKVNIPAPLNYDSRHNYMNELSLFLWSEYIGCESLNGDIKDRVQHQLYFKYRIEKDKVDREQSRIESLPTFDMHSKIMLVDDEAKKGWGNFYEYLFSDSENVEFKAVHFDKNNSESMIINTCLKQIEDFNPDVILLDLRLSEKDVFETESHKLTGYSVLEKVKEINRGIQVIVTTASNKTSIFRELNDAGSDDYIIKNIHPEVSCSNLIEAVKIAVKDAVYLKSISVENNKAIKAIKKKGLPKKVSGLKNIHDQLEHNQTNTLIVEFLKAAFETISNDKIKERYTMGILQLYRVIELVCEYYVEERTEKSGKSRNYKYVFEDSTELKHYYFDQGRYRSSLHNGSKMPRIVQAYNVFEHLSGKVDDRIFQSLFKLNSYRNNIAIHPEKRFKEESLEYLFSQDFNRFQKNISTYFSGVCNYLSDLIESN